MKEYDVERHEKFKEYEMQKALEEELKMKDMNELEKKAYQQEEAKRKTAHKKQAQNLPHPVSSPISSKKPNYVMTRHN